MSSLGRRRSSFQIPFCSYVDTQAREENIQRRVASTAISRAIWKPLIAKKLKHSEGFPKRGDQRYDVNTQDWFDSHSEGQI